MPIAIPPKLTPLPRNQSLDPAVGKAASAPAEGLQGRHVEVINLDQISKTESALPRYQVSIPSPREQNYSPLRHLGLRIARAFGSNKNWDRKITEGDVMLGEVRRLWTPNGPKSKAEQAAKATFSSWLAKSIGGANATPTDIRQALFQLHQPNMQVGGVTLKRVTKEDPNGREEWIPERLVRPDPEIGVDFVKSLALQMGGNKMSPEKLADFRSAIRSEVSDPRAAAKCLLALDSIAKRPDHPPSIEKSSDPDRFRASPAQHQKKLENLNRRHQYLCNTLSMPTQVRREQIGLIRQEIREAVAQLCEDYADAPPDKALDRSAINEMIDNTLDSAALAKECRKIVGSLPLPSTNQTIEKADIQLEPLSPTADNSLQMQEPPPPPEDPWDRVPDPPSDRSTSPPPSLPRHDGWQGPAWDSSLPSGRPISR